MKWWGWEAKAAVSCPPTAYSRRGSFLTSGSLSPIVVRCQLLAVASRKQCYGSKHTAPKSRCFNHVQQSQVSKMPYQDFSGGSVDKNPPVANQNHNEAPLHASQDGCYPKVYKQ